MKIKSTRLDERAEGLDLIGKLTNNDAKVLLIHYSCESFITSHGKTPRVTSISIRNFKNGQTASFSIHLQAQIKGYDTGKLTDQMYDELEKDMLDLFYEFVDKHHSYFWVHWNMRNASYGFEAIKNRYRILGGEPKEIDDDLKFDLPIILAKLYTKQYEQHEPDGKFLNLVRRNKITDRDVLTGKEEADAFDNKEYLKLHRSTLRKVDMMSAILNNLIRGSLVVNVNKKQIYGLSIHGLFEMAKNNPWLIVLFSLFTFILGAALEPVIQRLFGTA